MLISNPREPEAGRTQREPIPRLYLTPHELETESV